MRRFSLLEVGLASSGDRMVRQKLFGAERSIEQVLRSTPRLSSEELSVFVTEHFRFQLLSRPLDVSSVDLGNVVELGIEDGLGAHFDKSGGHVPALLGREALVKLGVGVTAPSLLRFAVAELVKNVDNEATVEVAVNTAHSAIVKLSNSGTLPGNLDWFVSTSQFQAGYAYGGAHGAALKGIGIGMQMAKCAMAAIGGSVHVVQKGHLVEACIVLHKQGDLKCV